MTVTLINASNPLNTQIEWDKYVNYKDGINNYFDGNHHTRMVRSWHSIPAIFETEFFAYKKENWEGVFDYENVIVLVNRDLKHVLPLLIKLKSNNPDRKVIIGYHENPADFFISSMNLGWLKDFVNLINSSDGQYNVMQFHEPFFRELHTKPILTCPHAVPYEEWKHTLTIPKNKRNGILIGTRTINQRLPRNTIMALVLAAAEAKRHNTFVTYLDEDHSGIENLLKEFNIDNVKVIQGPMPSYEDWLSLIARHKVVVHYDTSFTLGQVVTDALQVGVPCVGGLTDQNRISFTNTININALNCYIERHLKDWAQADNWEKDKEYLKSRTNFTFVKNQISGFFERIRNVD